LPYSSRPPPIAPGAQYHNPAEIFAKIVTQWR
jgi:hypothetical protein